MHRCLLDHLSRVGQGGQAVSSTYSAICLSHDPALIIGPDLTYDEASRLDSRGRLDGHQHCDIAIGRFSYPLIEVGCLGRQLPGPSGCRKQHGGIEWIDSNWLRLLHTARPHVGPELLRRHTFGCWPAERLDRLRQELGLADSPHLSPVRGGLT
jgi:hypothetical protein